MAVGGAGGSIENLLQTFQCKNEIIEKGRYVQKVTLISAINKDFSYIHEGYLIVCYG